MKLNLIHTTKTVRRFVLAAALATTGLCAEGLPIRVTVPFAFTVKGHVMPAGEYSIKPMEGMSGVVSLHHMTAGANLIALAMPGSDVPAPSTLTFAVVDDEKALTAVNAPGWTLAFAAPVPLSKPVAMKLEVPAVVVLASR